MKAQTLTDRPIGVFDSGLGGLTVLAPLLENLPSEATVYLGDLARTPYGDRTPEEIRRFSLQGVEFFTRRNVKALVVACNSASAVAMSDIISRAPFPVFDVVTPGSRLAASCSRSLAIGVMGTSATVSSQAYVYELKSLDINLSVHQVACPRLAPLIEDGRLAMSEYLPEVRACLQALPMGDLDTLILGCTHYPLIRGAIRAVVGDEIRLIDSGDATAEVVERELTERRLLRTSPIGGAHEYFVTSRDSHPDTERFRLQAKRFLGRKVPAVHHIPVRVSPARVEATR
ncbi:MAG: glutamate racemase [Candidatus Zixiibacteriota bacterium]